ncbi:38174_t:CDS:1, partial [Gigaspora margarita]
MYYSLSTIEYLNSNEIIVNAKNDKNYIDNFFDYATNQTWVSQNNPLYE